MVDKGKDLGISIRGGIEHGLGIYISAVEEYSVAESYGLKVIQTCYSHLNLMNLNNCRLEIKYWK